MKIRKFKKADAKEVCSLVRKSFMEFVAPLFARRGIRMFLSQQTPKQQVERAIKGNAYVAISDGKIVGMIEGNGKDKISRLFVEKKHQGRGIASALVSKIERTYTRNSKIRVFSSMYAVEFYKKMGYRKSTGVMRKNGFVYQPMIKKDRKK